MSDLDKKKNKDRFSHDALKSRIWCCRRIGSIQKRDFFNIVQHTNLVKLYIPPKARENVIINSFEVSYPGLALPKHFPLLDMYLIFNRRRTFVQVAYQCPPYIQRIDVGASAQVVYLND